MHLSIYLFIVYLVYPFIYDLILYHTPMLFGTLPYINVCMSVSCLSLVSTVQPRLQAQRSHQRHRDHLSAARQGPRSDATWDGCSWAADVWAPVSTIISTARFPISHLEQVGSIGWRAMQPTNLLCYHWRLCNLGDSEILCCKESPHAKAHHWCPLPSLVEPTVLKICQAYLSYPSYYLSNASLVSWSWTWKRKTIGKRRRRWKCEAVLRRAAWTCCLDGLGSNRNFMAGELCSANPCIEGSLEVKLLTINMDRWKSRDGKSQRRERKKKEDQRRERQQKEDQGAPKRRKVAKHRVVPMFWGSGGSKRRLAKVAGAEPSGQMRDEELHPIVVGAKLWKTQQVRSTFGSWDVAKVHTVWKSKVKMSKHTTFGALLKIQILKNCTPLRCEAHLEVKMAKTHHVRSTFGSSDVEKVDAGLARSTLGSQNVKNTAGSEHFWKLRCWKSARRCGAKHISK